MLIINETKYIFKYYSSVTLPKYHINFCIYITIAAAIDIQALWDAWKSNSIFASLVPKTSPHPSGVIQKAAAKPRQLLI